MGYWATLLIMVAVAATAAVRVAEGQPDATCANQLVPCIDYLNATTRPPASCCDPLREAVTNDLPCLCNLYRNPQTLAVLRVNITQALNLPVICGISGDTSLCNTATAPTSSHPSTPGNPRNGGTKIASAGIFSFLLIAASMLFF